MRNPLPQRRRALIGEVATALAIAALCGVYLAYTSRTLPPESARRAPGERPAAPARSGEPPPPAKSGSAPAEEAAPAAGGQPPAAAATEPEAPPAGLAPRAQAGGGAAAPAPQGPAAARPAAPRAPSPRERAVALARAGDTAAALAILEPLAAKEPGNLGVARDELAILGWAGRSADVVHRFERLPGGEPAYVLSAAARAYRDLKRPREALAVYSEGKGRFPDDSDFAAGEILVLTDMGDPEAALAAAEDALGGKVTVPLLLAAAYAALARGKPVDALRWCDQALELDPNDREAARDRILAIERMGAPHLALQMAKASPGLASEAELRRLEGSDAAELVRFGSLEPPSESERFAATDAAIARLDILIARFRKEGEAAKDDLLRARFDRLVAYQDRVRMADAVREYEALTAEGADIPAYALEPAAGAYLYLRQPEKARALYQRTLDKDPTDFSASLGLFYCLVELEEFDAAIKLIDALDAAQPKWLWLKGSPPLPNDARASADLAAAKARLYANDLEEAETRIKALADAAPADPAFRMSLGSLYGTRGWPRRAKEEFDIAANFAGDDPALKSAEADNALALKDYAQAEAITAELTSRFPETRDAQRAAEAWDLHNRPELAVSAGKTYESATSVQGGNGVAFDAALHSAPLDYNWRAFADEYIAEEHVVAGAESYFRHGAGLEWRAGGVTAAGEADLNSYGSDRPGGALRAAWALDDAWQLDGNAAFFAKDTPLAALKAGITANAAAATVGWRESELRSASLSGEVMDFSDGNLRGALDGEVKQRLWTSPHLTVDGSAGLAGSESSEQNRPYYNPRHDLLPSVGVDAVQVLYRRYELSWEHELTLRPGGYWEQGFGTGFAGLATYRHRLKTSDAFEVSLGLSLGSQSYDGQRVNSVALIFDLTWRPAL